MFFRSPKALALSAILLLIGCFQLLKGSYYQSVSKRETSTVGMLTSVRHGEGSSYHYRFKVGGVLIEDNSDSCRSGLTSAGCTVGAAVRVYYDSNDLSETLLEEFGAAGREKFFFGIVMASAGLLLIVLHFLSKKLLASPDESPDTDTDEDELSDLPEVIHVVPDK